MIFFYQNTKIREYVPDEQNTTYWTHNGERQTQYYPADNSEEDRWRMHATPHEFEIYVNGTSTVPLFTVW